MRLLIHDFAGHPFAVQLSRALARRGHTVLHVYAAANPTPKGALAPKPDDPDGLAIEGLAINGRGAYARDNFFSRYRYERAYGRALAARVGLWRPEVAVFCNTPLDALVPACRAGREFGVRTVLWMQDLLGLAAFRILARRLPILGAAIGWHHIRLERRLARAADAVVAITGDFVPILVGWGVPRARIAVIANWGPLGEIVPGPRDNEWARAHALGARPVFLYTGMMGMKHDPGLILDLARHFGARADIVVVFEGRGANILRAAAATEGLGNLLILPFQPYDRLGEVLAAGDVMLAVLEAEAGAFAVPSKVLGYFCAGRPVLAAIPAENLAARLIVETGAGVVVAPGDRDSWLAQAERLLADAPARARMAQAGRAHAEAAFDVEAIAARFEAVLGA